MEYSFSQNDSFIGTKVFKTKVPQERTFHGTKVRGMFAPEERKFHRSECSRKESSTGAKVLSVDFSLPGTKVQRNEKAWIQCNSFDNHSKTGNFSAESK